MGILLLLVGLLAVVSGALKLRTRGRARIGSSTLAGAEAVAGGLLVIGAGVGLARVRPIAWLTVALVLVLIVASTSAHVRRTLRHSKCLEASEGRRLRSYLQSRGTPMS